MTKIKVFKWMSLSIIKSMGLFALSSYSNDKFLLSPEYTHYLQNLHGEGGGEKLEMWTDEWYKFVGLSTCK